MWIISQKIENAHTDTQWVQLHEVMLKFLKAMETLGGYVDKDGERESVGDHISEENDNKYEKQQVLTIVEFRVW